MPFKSQNGQHPISTSFEARHSAVILKPQSRYPRRGFMRGIRELALIGWRLLGAYFVFVFIGVIVRFIQSGFTDPALLFRPTEIERALLPFLVLPVFRPPWGGILAFSIALFLLICGFWAKADRERESQAVFSQELRDTALTYLNQARNEEKSLGQFKNSDQGSDDADSDKP